MRLTRNWIWQWILLAALGAGTVFLLTVETGATLKYKRETEKSCTFCHTGIPRKGDEDPQLTEDGKKFRENGYRLTDEQKRATAAVSDPDPAPR
ncbi:MAG: hypothetical protein HYX74_03475 [Acidobacteria bacterium]|nr:hypothetical protein [Acidobacteriota bacterium]